MPDITLHRAPATRAFAVLWMLEELGVPYRSQLVDYRRPTPDFLALNPSGQVPVLVDGATVITEVPAICLYLADRYSAGVLAPLFDDSRRGPFLAWLVYATAQLEPARRMPEGGKTDKAGNWGGGWAPLADVIARLADAVRDRPYLLGDTFTAADLVIGATLAMSFVTHEIPADPALVAYSARLGERPAAQRAGALNWPVT